jgi:hypothetical protein
MWGHDELLSYSKHLIQKKPNAHAASEEWELGGEREPLPTDLFVARNQLYLLVCISNFHPVFQVSKDHIRFMFILFDDERLRQFS